MIKEFTVNGNDYVYNFATKIISQMFGSVWEFQHIELKNLMTKNSIYNYITQSGWHTYQNYVKIKIPDDYQLGIERAYMRMSPKRFHVHLVDFLPLHRFHQADCEMEITQEKESWFVEVVW